MAQYHLIADASPYMRRKLMKLGGFAAAGIAVAILAARAGIVNPNGRGIPVAGLAIGVALGALIFIGLAWNEIRQRGDYLLTVTDAGIQRQFASQPPRSIARANIRAVRGFEDNRGLIIFGPSGAKPIHVPPGLMNFDGLLAELAAIGFKPVPIGLRRR